MSHMRRKLPAADVRSAALPASERTVASRPTGAIHHQFAFRMVSFSERVERVQHGSVNPETSRSAARDRLRFARLLRSLRSTRLLPLTVWRVHQSLVRRSSARELSLMRWRLTDAGARFANCQSAQVYLIGCAT